MNQQALEAAEKAVIKVLNDCVSSGIAWRPGTLALAHAALTAYAEATGERVVYNNTDRFPMTFSHVGVRSFTVEPGEQIVARKVGT